MAISLVAHSHASGNPNYTTSAIDTTGATLLHASMSGFGSTGVLTDSANNTWIVLPLIGSSSVQTTAYCINPTTSATHTFTITGGSFGGIEVTAWSGVTGVLPFDVTNSATGTGSTAQAGSVTPSNANSLVIIGLGYQNSGPTLSGIGSGFTISDTDPAGSIIGGSCAYLIQTSIVAENPTWTFSGSLIWSTRICVFIEGTAVPPTDSALLAHVGAFFTGTSVTTSAIDTSGATILIANITGTGTPVGTLSDSKSNTWFGLTQRGFGSVQQRLFYAKNPTVGSGHTFSVTSGNAGTIEVAAFSNMELVTPFDVENGSVVTGAANQYGSITPSQTLSLLISGLAYQNAGPEITGVDVGFKITDIETNASVIKGALAYLIQQAAVAENPLWTFTASVLTAANNAVFKIVAPVTIIQVPTAALVIATFAPTLDLTDTLEVPAAALTIATYAPTVDITTTTFTPGTAHLTISTYPPFLGRVVLDEDFQSYPVGDTPPFTTTEGNGIIQDSISGPYTDTQSLLLGSTESINYPILPAITLPQALAGVTYESLGVPTYTEATIWQALYINYYPVMNGDILILHSNLSPFAGVAVFAVRMLPDGTVAITAPRSSAFSNNQAISTYTLYPGKWYFFQTNVAFTPGVSNMIIDVTVAVNGVPIVTATWTTAQPLSALPVLYFNQVEFGSAGNGVLVGRLTMDTNLEPMPSFPHPGSPVARVSQGVIEIAKFLFSTVPLSAECVSSSAPLGVAYSQTINVIGGVAPFTFAVTTGSLPTGLSVGGSTGIISGTPTVVGSYSFKITITDALSVSYVLGYCIILVPPGPIRPARICTSQT